MLSFVKFVVDKHCHARAIGVFNFVIFLALSFAVLSKVYCFFDMAGYSTVTDSAASQLALQFRNLAEDTFNWEDSKFASGWSDIASADGFERPLGFDAQVRNRERWLWRWCSNDTGG